MDGRMRPCSGHLSAMLLRQRQPALLCSYRPLIDPDGAQPRGGLILETQLRSSSASGCSCTCPQSLACCTASLSGLACAFREQWCHHRWTGCARKTKRAQHSCKLRHVHTPHTSTSRHPGAAGSTHVRACRQGQKPCMRSARNRPARSQHRAARAKAAEKRRIGAHLSTELRGAAPLPGNTTTNTTTHKSR